MVPLLAKNAVKIKSGFQNAAMTGNYECAYALGILNYNLGLEKITDYNTISDLKENVLKQAEHFETEDGKLRQMLKILREYEASDEIDDQMRELFDMGFDDKKL